MTTVNKFHPNVEKQLSRIPRAYARKIADAIRTFSEEPRPSQARHLEQEMYRLREGDYRIFYAVFDDQRVVFVGKVERRSERAYRDIEKMLPRARQAVREAGGRENHSYNCEGFHLEEGVSSQSQSGRQAFSAIKRESRPRPAHLSEPTDIQQINGCETASVYPFQSPFWRNPQGAKACSLLIAIGR